MKNLVILSGAGMSAESGLKTFRDSNGLWEGHNVYEVATPEGFAINPELVLSFYNQRRSQLALVSPNLGHKAIAASEEFFNVDIVTQNVDNLHERAGSSHVLHLHGELIKAQSTLDESYIVDCEGDIALGDKCPQGGQLRPFIVWFGEPVPLLEQAAALVAKADIVIIVGTSMQVYPAASLIEYANADTQVYYIDTNPEINPSLEHCSHLHVIADKASSALPKLLHRLSGEAL